MLDVRQKRRIYDITNVLEGIGLIEKETKNTIRWKCVCVCVCPFICLILGHKERGMEVGSICFKVLQRFQMINSPLPPIYA